jgi:hypothetical protein
MSIYELCDTFAGLPVVEFHYDDKAPPKVDDPAKVAWRITCEYEDDEEAFTERFGKVLDAAGEGLTALIIGEWGEAYDREVPIDQLVAAAPRLPNLRALFVGEMTGEQCEISWIKQTDVTPLLTAYPKLEVLRIRGADGLEFSPVRHEALRELAFESGGLPAEVVRAAGECDLPALEHLELWLGTDSYGGDATVEDLAGVLSGGHLPRLRYLGLRDAEIADQVAAAVAAAPVVARLTELDLSLGVMSDTGAEALLAGQPLTHLRRLNLSHHYISPAMAERLVAELPGVEVDLSDEQDEDDEDRYVAVSE